MGAINSRKRIAVHFQPAVCVCVCKLGGLGVQFPYIYHTPSVPITIHSYCSRITPPLLTYVLLASSSRRFR
jgi:hypothetical protein